MYGGFLPFLNDSYITMKVQEVKPEGRRPKGADRRAQTDWETFIKGV